MFTQTRPSSTIRTFILRFFVVVAVFVAMAIVAQATPSVHASGDYKAEAGAASAALQQYYNTSNGQFNTTGWWNSANALGTLIDYSARTGVTTYDSDIANTFAANSSGNFLNEFYDDEGWWGLTWIKAYDLTGNTDYLNMSKTIFADMSGGWDSTCNGGVWWSKSRNYKNAIPNELFLSLATKISQRTPGDTVGGGGGPQSLSYIDWATKEWTWFSNSGMINSSNLINDGLNSSCQNNNDITWTYNQGVILSGLADLTKITGQSSYQSQAESIANATINTLVNSNGILKESCDPSCSGDGFQFKGVFMRNLAYLYSIDSNQNYANFFSRNADSIWANNRNGSNQLGSTWYGPFDSADASRQSSALDALNAAIPFSSSGPSTTNVALNKSATANSSCSGSEGASNAVDGSIINNSKWCAGATNGQYWLQIDLGANANIVSFTIQHAGAGGEDSSWNTRDFNIQTSTDSSNWSTVVDVQGNTSNVTTHSISTTSARYIKLNITNPQTSNQNVAARIYELEVYATSNNVDAALNKSATANGSCASNEGPAKAVDGSTSNGSKWCAGATNGQYWLQVDMGASVPVARYIVEHAGAGGENSNWNTRNFMLQISTNGSNWITVVAVSGNTANETNNVSLSTSARYVKLVITKAQTDTQYVAARIYELKVYNS